MASCGRCGQRATAIVRGVSALARGDAKTAVSSAAYVGRTLAQDARSGALRNAAANQLTALRASIMRRR